MNVPTGALTVKGRATQKRIFNAAIELINKKGYEETTIIDICELSGVSNGSFYHHFKSKNDILIRYVQRESEELEEYYRSLKADSNKEALKKVFKWQIDHYLLKGHNFIANLNAILILNKYEHNEPFTYSMEEVFSKCIEKGQQSGEFRKDISALQMGSLVFDSVFSLSSVWCMYGEDYPFEEEVYQRFNSLMKLFA